MAVPACGTVSVPSLLRRLAPLAAAALAAVALSACGAGTPSPRQSGSAATHRTTTTTSSPATTTSSPATTTTAPVAQEVTFSPFTAQGSLAPGLQVAQQVSGHCTNPGVAGSASYHCVAEPGDIPYDPCFAPPGDGGGGLLCVPGPTVTEVIRFSSSALPDASTTVPAHRVWAMRLQNGQVCVLIDAQWNGRGPFACPTPALTGSMADCRTPTKTAEGWSTSCQAKEAATSPFGTTPVVNVWT
jgi:hypothetical protein